MTCHRSTDLLRRSRYDPDIGSRIELTGGTPIVVSAERLAMARARSGYGQEDVANALGVRRAMVSYWESGRRKPNDRQLVAIAQLLRCPSGFCSGRRSCSLPPT